MKHARPLSLVLVCLALAACSGGSSNNRIDYKQAKTLPPLEVPPELSEPVDTGVDSVPELAATAAGTGTQGTTRVLPQAENIRIARDGSRRWLMIDAEAATLWPKLRQFWSSLGMEVKVDEPLVGIMETQWAENRAETPQGFFARMVKKVFRNAYSAGTLDKFRIRLEPLDDGRTELFLTHYGLREVVPEKQSGEVMETAWEVRPSDPELANELLNRLVLYLGGSKETAEAVLADPDGQPASKTRLAGDSLIVDEGFSRAWRLTGLALDRAGLVVEDRNRSAGIYYVSRVDLLADAGLEKKEGWFSSLFSSSDKEATDGNKEQIQIRLAGDDASTRITVRDGEGGVVPERVAQAVLKRLQGAFE